MSSTRPEDSVLPEPHEARLTRTRRRQIHIWLSEREYEWLQHVAEFNDQSASELIRSMLVRLRHSSPMTPDVH